ncbi:MFS transporter [Actinomyces oricola]|uniref:MFS transporter n=1 Tax=Actinomyces oricola TaxID=206043 RepID=UPI000FFF1EDC|nr:MFS transporter [Actinomyces oricola]
MSSADAEDNEDDGAEDDGSGRADYLAWLCADTSWQLGSVIGTFAFMMVALDVTGSTAQAGLVSTVAGGAAAALSVPGGMAMDRVDRRGAIIASGVLRAVLYTAVAVMCATGHAGLGVLMVCGALAGLITGVFGTASDAALPSVVSGERLPGALAVNRGRDGVVNIVGQPISGILLALGSRAPFVASVIGALGQAAGISRVRTDLHPLSGDGDHGDAPRAPQTPVTWELLLRVLLQPISLALLGSAVLLNVQVLLLVDGMQMALRIAGASTAAVGLLNTVMAAGVLVGALPASWIIRRVRAGWIIVVGSLLCTVVVVPALVHSGRAVQVVTMALIGLPAATMNGCAFGYVQHVVPKAGQGRALALVGLIIAVISAAVPVTAGVLLEVGGLRLCLLVALLLGALATLVAVAVSPVRRLARVAEW